MSMTKTDKQALRLLATKATPGKWWVDSHGSAVVSFTDDSMRQHKRSVGKSNKLGFRRRAETTAALICQMNFWAQVCRSNRKQVWDAMLNAAPQPSNNN